MIYRIPNINEIPEILEMKHRVKQRVTDSGLPMWLNGYPADEMLVEDIELGDARVIELDGKIIKATSISKEDINKIFDIDEGARYVGEFAIGVNPYIDKPMLNILYDEKIKGSIHFTPGSCYDDCNNGNKSAIHWDLIQVQTEEYGGGEIYFDDVLIRKDGRFVIDELMGLNPENLI